MGLSAWTNVAPSGEGLREARLAFSREEMPSFDELSHVSLRLHQYIEKPHFASSSFSVSLTLSISFPISSLGGVENDGPDAVTSGRSSRIDIGVVLGLDGGVSVLAEGAPETGPMAATTTVA